MIWYDQPNVEVAWMEDITMFDTRLYIFKAVADRKSFSLAAQDLYMTQSAVSQYIGALEAYYGLRLFNRLHRRISLTEAGEKLYSYVVEIEKLYQEAEKAMRSLAGSVSGRLHIGASLTIGEYLLPEVLAKFNQSFPSVDIAMDIFNTEQITNMVLEGQVDAGFIEGALELPPSLDGQVCGGDELVIIAPKTGTPYDGPVTIEKLLEQRWIVRESTSGTRTSFEAFLSKYAYDPTALNIGMELGSTQAIKEAVKSGLGIAPISSLAVANEVERGEFRILSLIEGPVSRSFTLITNRNKVRTYTTEKFLEFVLQHL